MAMLVCSALKNFEQHYNIKNTVLPYENKYSSIFKVLTVKLQVPTFHCLKN